MWQEIIVGLCVLLAVIFLIRRWFFSSTKKSAACGGCGGCETNSQSNCVNPLEKGRY